MLSYQILPHPFSSTGKFIVIDAWGIDPVGELCEVLDHVQKGDFIFFVAAFGDATSRILSATISQYMPKCIDLLLRFSDRPVEAIISRHLTLNLDCFDSEPFEKWVKEHLSPQVKYHGIQIDYLERADPLASQGSPADPEPPTHEQLVEVAARIRAVLTSGINLSVTENNDGSLLVKAVRFKTAGGVSIPAQQSSFDVPHSLDSYSVLYLLADTLEDICRPLTPEPESIVNTQETP